MASYQEFAAAIKAKYPQYKDVDDLKLAQTIVQKHPEYADRVSFDAPQSNPGLLETLLPREAAARGRDASYGPQVGATLADLFSLPGRAAASTGKEVAHAALNQGDFDPGRVYSGMAQTGGAPDEGKAAQVAETIARSPATIPAIATGGLTEMIPGLAALPAVARAAAIGGAGGVGAAAGDQASRVGEGRGISPGEAALEVGTNAAIPAVGNALGPALKGAGTKIVESVIKPSKALVKKGFSGPALMETGMAGGLQGTLARLEAKIEDLGGKVESALSANPNATVDLTQSLAKTKQQFAQEMMQGEHAGLQDDITKGLGEWGDDMANRPLGLTDLLTANQYKQGVGKLGKWNRGQNPSEIPAKARVANEFYDNIRNDIAAQAPEVAPLNAEMSKLIPMRQAVQDAVVRTNKNYGVGLKEAGALAAAANAAAMGGAGAARIPLELAATLRLSQNPYFGAKVYGLGKSLGEENAARDAIKRAILAQTFSGEQPQ